MKIAMVIDAWDPIVGGWQVHVLNLCKKLISNHWCEVDLFVRSLRWEDWKIYNQDELLCNWKLKIIRCWRPKTFFNFFERILSIFSIALKIIKEYKRQQYDLIHAHAFLGLLSWKIASVFLKIPIIWTIHWANLLDKWTRSFYYYVEKILLTFIKYNLEITVWSSFLIYHNFNKNIKIIWNWVNIEDFRNVNSFKNTNIYKILFVWRLEWTKGIDILIEAINLINRSILDNSNVQIHLIWYGYQEDIYKTLVTKYNLEKYIFFRWKIIWEDLVKEYLTSNLFVLPSRTEGFWITIIEAMTAKIPVIATRCGWPVDIIENWINWFLIEKENSIKLSEIINDLINNKIDNIYKIIDNWYKTVVEKYTWDNIVNQIFKEYLILNK